MDVTSPVRAHAQASVRTSNPFVYSFVRKAVLLWVGAFSLFWALVPSEWSFIDDPALKTGLLDTIRAHGVVAGVATRIGDVASADAHWGLFRPMYWLYCGVFYLATPPFAHLIRAAMFAVAVGAPLVYLVRGAPERRLRPALGVFALSLLLSNISLYNGLTYHSLQELSGIAFVALGLLTARSGARSILWLLAAWFKAPFVWLVLAWSVVLVVTGRRRIGAATGAAGIATVVMAYLWAQTGTYTSGFAFSSHNFRLAVLDFAHKAIAPGAVAVIGLVALRVRPRWLLHSDGAGVALAIGALGYFGNLLPWARAGGYYASPILWMASTALLISLSKSPAAEITTQPTALRMRLVNVGGSLAVAVAGTAAAVHAANVEYERSVAMAGIREWALSLPSSGVRISINDGEASHRLVETARLHKPSWSNTVVFEFPPDPSAQYFVDDADHGVLVPPGGTVIRHWARATIYRLKS